MKNSDNWNSSLGGDYVEASYVAQSGQSAQEKAEERLIKGSSSSRSRGGATLQKTVYTCFHS